MGFYCDYKMLSLFHGSIKKRDQIKAFTAMVADVWHVGYDFIINGANGFAEANH